MLTKLVNNKSQKDFFLEIETSLSHSIGQYFQEFLQKDSKSLNVITCSVFDAVRIKEEISWFFPKLKVNLLPDWETLPYDQISPHPDLTSERLLTLYQMTKKEFDINLIPISTALHLVPPRNYIEKYSFQFKKNQNVDIETFKEKLVNNEQLFGENHFGNNNESEESESDKEMKFGEECDSDRDSDSEESESDKDMKFGIDDSDIDESDLEEESDN